MADGGGLVVARAVQGTLGAFTVASVRLEGAGLAGCRGAQSTEGLKPPTLSPDRIVRCEKSFRLPEATSTSGAFYFSNKKRLVSITCKTRVGGQKQNYSLDGRFFIFQLKLRRNN